MTTTRVTLASRAQVDFHDRHLHSAEGAERIASEIAGRRVVHKLLLSYNELGDDGCVTLFKFLASAAGRRHPISEINLGSNEIGNTGLLAITEYMKNNLHLRSLHLPNNCFTDDASAFTAFSHAINTSHIETLNLASNDSLSDSFVQNFVPSLQCPTLRWLNLTATRLTSKSVPYLREFLSSTLHCQLDSFSCNMNQLGIPGVSEIVESIYRHNYRLTKVNLYSNQGEVDNLDEAVEESKEALRFLTLTLMRNTHLKRETQQDALRLLRYSRPLLLNYALDLGNDVRLQIIPPCSETCSCIPSASNVSTYADTRRLNSPFLRLPSELKQHILSFFAPNLSSAQRIRVYHYASSASTLPQLLPCLPHPGSPAGHSLCLPDPSSLGFGDSGRVWSIGGGGVGAGGGCESGECLGSENSVLCHREQDRTTWLAAVGCDTYDPNRDSH